MTRHRDLIETDVAIIGGGLNGAALALALEAAGLSAAVFDAAPIPDRTDDGFDGRASAIAAGARRMLERLGVWRRLAETAQPIADILVTDGRVSDGASSLFLHFDHREIGPEPFGHMVENRHLRRALYAAIAESDAIRHEAPAPVASLERDAGWATLTLADGRAARARLAVACDGRGSPTARAAGIRHVGWAYPQAGIVCTVAHEQPHCGVAHEYFLPSGPFAILPLTGNRSSLVWTERREIAAAAMRLEPDAFEGEVRRRFGGFLGAVRVVGPRWSYPLGFSLAREYVRPRLALVGDSAHGLHPIAGQGFNLGLKDAAALAEVLCAAARRGEDIGAQDVLERYQRWRRFDNAAMGLGMDALNRLFSNDLPPVRALRGLGLSLVNRAGPARRFFMRQAAGAAGALPTLFRGEAL